jgi:hypothetical protein
MILSVKRRDYPKESAPIGTTQTILYVVIFCDCVVRNVIGGIIIATCRPIGNAFTII